MWFLISRTRHSGRLVKILPVAQAAQQGRHSHRLAGQVQRQSEARMWLHYQCSWHLLTCLSACCKLAILTLPPSPSLHMRNTELQLLKAQLPSKQSKFGATWQTLWLKCPRPFKKCCRSSFLPWFLNQQYYLLTSQNWEWIHIIKYCNHKSMYNFS